MRNGRGSRPFVFSFPLIMATWAIINTRTVTGHRGFDPYPFILLSLILSTLAGLQAAALLIAAERSDAIASEIAIHTERNTEEIKRLLRQNTELIEAIEALTREVHMRIVGDGKGERPHTPGPL